MNDSSPSPSTKSESGRSLATLVYILYFVGYFTGLTALIGAIIAHIKVSEVDEIHRTHLRYQIRTFWLGLLMIVIGSVTAIFLIGYLFFLAAFVWSLVRNIKGVLLVLEGRPINNPATFLW